MTAKKSPAVVKTDVKEIEETPAKAPAKAKAKPAPKKTGSLQVPKGAKNPQDHRSARDEVQAPESYDFEWNGHSYKVEVAAMDDVEVMEHLTDNNSVGALRLMLGDKLWERYKKEQRDATTGRVKASDATDFLNLIFEELDAKNS